MMRESNSSGHPVEHPSEDLAAFALGALEPAEVVAIEAHLEGCESCRAELRRLAPAVDVLPSAVPQLEAPRRLRRKLLAQTRAEAGSESGARWMHPGTWFTSRTWPGVALAAMALLGAAVAVYAVSDSERRRQPTVTEVQAEPTGEASQAAAVLVYGAEGPVLRVERLPELARGDVYQLWVREGNTMHPDETFTLDAQGRAEAALEGLPSGADEILVTREPRGGSRSPSTKPILRAPLS